jgi:hypothetical protein
LPACLPACSALASCSSISNLHIIEYVSAEPVAKQEMCPEQHTREPALLLDESNQQHASRVCRQALTEALMRHHDMNAGCITAAAASRSHKYCNWLPALVQHLSKQLQLLRLELQAPLPTAQQPLLLQLKGLHTLSCVLSQARVLGLAVPLLPEVVCGLSALQQLRSLAVTMGNAARQEQEIQVCWQKMM